MGEARLRGEPGTHTPPTCYVGCRTVKPAGQNREGLSPRTIITTTIAPPLRLSMCMPYLIIPSYRLMNLIFPLIYVQWLQGSSWQCQQDGIPPGTGPGGASLRGRGGRGCRAGGRSCCTHIYHKYGPFGCRLLILRVGTAYWLHKSLQMHSSVICSPDPCEPLAPCARVSAVLPMDYWGRWLGSTPTEAWRAVRRAV